MKRTFYNCVQGSDEWFSVRNGIVTASMFDAVMAKGQGKTRRSYMLTLIGERLTGFREESYTNAHMERGKEMEEEARQLYSLITGYEVLPIGFIKLGDDIGCSPDGGIKEAGLLEIKTKLPKLQLECLFKNEIPADHIKQVQGQLWVSGREWCDFMSYWSCLKPFVKREYRDEKIISSISSEVNKFIEEMYELINRYEKV